MKIIRKIFLKSIFIASLLLLTISCNKVGSITYPKSTNYGENLLARTENYVEKGESYSLEADLTKKCDLKIVITNTSEINTDPEADPPKWAFNNNKGWTIGNYESKAQIFTTTVIGKNDLNIVFSGEEGSCRIDYYENTSSITRTKTISW
jgi:hypothetical protein